MRYEGESGGGSSTSIPLKDGKLLDYLKNEFDRHGELTISNITDNTIQLTTSRTVEHHELEGRIGEIGDLIRNYVKSRAIEMDAYAIFAKGELKGVFGQGYNSRFKKSRLIREGFKEEEIEIKPINIESFNDIY
ncbi:hypothetical protein GCM10008931_43950 [Oceanobacillus oncorhynchi subsp. oncorhynchi]